MTTNPLIAAIPEGAEVTVYTRGGHSHTGTDDTTTDESERGLFVLFALVESVPNVQSVRPRRAGVLERSPTPPAKTCRRIVLLASDITGYAMEYDPA
ncbi:TPA: hypothetical protein SH447_004504 [Salmonella enterica]|jgi:hypothetical protein|nr:hypothetical protein [Staphylococcus aureus]HDH7443247.1 hypothetical protein [Escherichia coli]HDW3906738.1 hypothetical protein [Escherichia coli]HEH8885988.1 hypothetical protein [Salmonella enterica]